MDLSSVNSSQFDDSLSQKLIPLIDFPEIKMEFMPENRKRAIAEKTKEILRGALITPRK